MPKDIFQMSAPDLILLRRMYKRAPKKMQRVVAGVLNTEAFEMRPIILKIIDSDMIIRSPGFVKKHVVVSKAVPGPIRNQQAEVGSTFGERFTGWEEQQFGDKGKQKSVASKFARGGQWQGKIRQKLRRQQSNPLWRPSDFNIRNAVSEKHRLIIFLQMLNQRRIKDRFYMPDRLGEMTGGAVYKMQSGNIRGVYRKKTRKTSVTRWMDRSIDFLLKEINILKIWDKNVKFVFKLKK